MPNRLSSLLLRDIDSNSTRWDVASASPSDEVMHQQFAILATINAVVALSCALLIISILRVRKVHQRAFNIYLLAITFPDFVTSFSCFITCAMSSAAYTYYSEVMCRWQTWYLVWGFTSNCWMNAVVSHQLYTMLRISHRRGRYNPPTRKRVALHAACVYLNAGIIACIATWQVPFLPFKSGSYQGLACFPKDYDNASTLFFWLVFVPTFLLIPFGYFLWCCVEILRKGMLPPVGLRRDLALYFFRLFLVFFFMWLPFIIFAFVTRNENSWVGWFGAAWSHLQGLVSVLFGLTKADIKEGFLETYTFEAMCMGLPCSKVSGSDTHTDLDSDRLEVSNDHTLSSRRVSGDHMLASVEDVFDNNMTASVDEVVVDETEDTVEDDNTLHNGCSILRFKN